MTQKRNLRDLEQAWEHGDFVDQGVDPDPERDEKVKMSRILVEADLDALLRESLRRINP